jgi:16S rRNA (guanine527-N7)-methyltransferase
MRRDLKEEAPRRETVPRTKQAPQLPSASTLAEGRSALLERRDVSHETLADLDRFVALLLQWQLKTNLVAPSTLGEIWTRHIEDSLQLHTLSPLPKRWVDLGSGAGFPGIILGICQKGQSDKHVDLVESNAKKAAFLRTVIRETGISATVHAERIEDCGSVLSQAEAVSARALASLDILLGFVAGRIPREIPCYFAKGRRQDEEIVDAAAHWRFTVVKHSSTVEADSSILEVREIEPL